MQVVMCIHVKRSPKGGKSPFWGVGGGGGQFFFFLFLLLVEMDRNDAQTSFECILATFSLFCSNLKLPLSYHSTLWPLDGDILKLAQLAFLVTLLLFSDIY